MIPPLAYVLPRSAVGKKGRSVGRIRRGPNRASSDRPPLRIDQHFAAADMVGDADDTVFLHPLDQSRGIVVADAELALEIGGRRLLALRHRLHRLAVELRLGIVLAGR